MRKNPHDRILRKKLKVQHLSIIPKSCPLKKYISLSLSLILLKKKYISLSLSLILFYFICYFYEKL